MRSFATIIVASTALWKYVTADTTCLPLTTSSNLCSSPPGTNASDGLDDVCVLVACCNGGNAINAQLPNLALIPCNTVNCFNVCTLSIMRSNLGAEACDSTCIPPSPPSEPTYDMGIC